MKYDVVIVGAGPAGLKAAEILAKNNKKVLVLEKNKVIGPKVCAAGITQKDLEYIPNEIVEKELDSIVMHWKNKKIRVKNKVYTIDRKALGQYQLQAAIKSGAEVKTCCVVKEIRTNSVIADKEYFFEYLIGADGSNSLVRRHLGLEAKCISLAVQYKINQVPKDMAFHYDTKKYGPWYVWVFPHENYTYVGIGTGLHFKDRKYLKHRLDEFMESHNLSVKNVEFEAALINADYQGHKFKNIFLVGDAAGLVNPFTGEGIYQALASGEEIAKKIVNPEYRYPKLRKLIDKNQKLKKLLLLLINIPGILSFSYGIGFKLIKYKPFRKLFLRVFYES